MATSSKLGFRNRKDDNRHRAPDERFRVYDHAARAGPFQIFTQPFSQ